MAYPPTELPNDTGNISPNKAFDLKDFNDRFRTIKTYIESLKEGIDADKTDVSNLSNNKVDKVPNYGLSKNDFTDSYKATLDNLSTTLNNYVLKDGDKVLSTNDFTNTYKDYLTTSIGKSNLLSELYKSIPNHPYNYHYADFQVTSVGNFSFTKKIETSKIFILGWYIPNAHATGSGGGLQVNNVSLGLEARLFTGNSSWSSNGYWNLSISGNVPNLGSQIDFTIRVLWTTI